MNWQNCIYLQKKHPLMYFQPWSNSRENSLVLTSAGVQPKPFSYSQLLSMPATPSWETPVFNLHSKCGQDQGYVSSTGRPCKQPDRSFLVDSSQFPTSPYHLSSAIFQPSLQCKRGRSSLNWDILIPGFRTCYCFTWNTLSFSIFRKSLSPFKSQL